MTVADVVDVARHFDVRGAGFDAGGGGDLVMVARAAGDRRRVTEVVKKVIDRSENRRGRRQVDSAIRAATSRTDAQSTDSPSPLQAFSSASAMSTVPARQGVQRPHERRRALR